jgi:CRP-like cAMP-binding protein
VADADALYRTIQATRGGTRLYGRGSHLLLPADPAEAAFTLYAGWAAVYQLLDDGRHHIAQVYLPGETVGLDPDAGVGLSYGVVALTDVTVCVFELAQLHAAALAAPALGWHLARLLADDRTRLYDNLANLGRRTAAERLGFFCLDLYRRARARQLTEGDVCPFPLKQTQIGDALGLSAVHVSRMVQDLRERGSLDLGHGALRMIDEAALARLCRAGPATRPAGVLL